MNLNKFMGYLETKIISLKKIENNPYNPIRQINKAAEYRNEINYLQYLPSSRKIYIVSESVINHQIESADFASVENGKYHKLAYISRFPKTFFLVWFNDKI